MNEKLSDPYSWPSLRRMLLTVMLALAIVVVFMADTLTDYGLAFPVFYCVIILAAMRVYDCHVVKILAPLCIILTIISFLLTEAGAYQIGMTNSALSIVAICVTSWLALQMASAQRMARLAHNHLSRLARLSSMGELVTSIAHELNQPLAGLTTSAQACQRWLAMKPPSLDKARAAAERMIDDAHRASAVVERVRALTRGEAPMRAFFDLNVAAIEVACLIRTECERHGVTITMKLGEALPLAFADRIQVQQVIGNLLLNAAEAMSHAGARARTITLGTALAPDAVLQCWVADRGPGMAPEERERMFDAFWSTKENGLGLGLAISRSIVQANGGRIEAQARPGGGLVCIFTLTTAAQEKT